MKTIKLILPILLLLIVGCDEDATSPDDACVELTTSYSDAATEFGTDMTMVNCEAQYAALGAWCDGDCEPSDTAEEDAICSDMSDLDSASITAMCELLLDIADEGDSSDSDDEDDSSDSDDEDAPPECASDCAGYDSMIGEDETDDYDVWCGWLSTWSTEGCLSDCTADELEENAEVLFLVEVCTECLENDNCEEVIDGEEEDGDDDIPECFLDCDLSIFLSPTATCEFFGGDDISCSVDCTGDDAAMLTLYPIMCGTCVEDGDCDDIFGDDDDDSDDGDESDDDFPECLLDCGDLGNLAGDPVDVGQDVYCNELTAFDDSCLSDCDDDFIAFFNIQLIQCEACLENDNCECYFVDESPEGCDDDDDEDGDESDDGPPDCFLDCPDVDTWFESSGTDTCTALVDGYNEGCMEDCDVDGDDQYEMLDMITACQGCLEASNCDELFTDECDECHDDCDDDACHDDCDENYCDDDDDDGE